MFVEKCGACGMGIDDGIENSIMCDVCMSWVHSERKCSNVKKSIMNLMTKKDPFTCSKCLDMIRDYSIEIGLGMPVITLRVELETLRNECNLKDSRIESLNSQVNEKEARILELQELVEELTSTIGEGKKGESVGSWRKQGSSGAPGGVYGDMDSFPPLPTSNRFSVLGDGSVYEDGMNEGASGGHAWRVDDGVKKNVNDGRMRRNWGMSGRTNGNLHVKGKSKVNRESRDKGIYVKECDSRDSLEKLKQEKLKLKPKSETIVLVTDSQGRRCGQLLNMKVSDEIGVEAWVMPAASNLQVIEKACKVVEGRPERDHLVVLGGVNGVCERSVSELSDRLEDLAGRVGNRRVTFVEAPYRYDFIKAQNRIIEKACMRYKWVFLDFNSQLTTSCYTRPRIHLNMKGKNLLTSLIMEHLDLQANSSYKKNEEAVASNRIT